MKANDSRPKSVAEYINAASPEARRHLRAMRACIRTAASGAKEELKWGMPAYSYRRILVIFGGFKHHVSLFPTPSAVRAFAKQLAKYKFAKGSIQFALNQPLPLSLIRQITAFRVKESLAADKKWRTEKR